MKPTVFFSHSSLDSERIKPIKDHIIEKTGNAIQIFLSSDGASIPFGKNWLKEIEQALTTCKLMFVWLTPNSAKSNWIYFESGYAYSRNIKVVPVGFDGIKLEDLKPPLNLLQGFNINSANSLNNIIAVINNEFCLTFPLMLFDEVFYEKEVSKLSTENSPELLKYINAVRCTFHPWIKDSVNTISLKENWFGIFKDVLVEKGETFTQENAELYGVGYKIQPSRDAKPHPEILIDPLSLNNVLNVLIELNNRTYESKFNKLSLTVDLTGDYYLLADHYFVSARLMNTEIDFKTSHPNLLYRYRNILFRINIQKNSSGELMLFFDFDRNGKIPLLSLIKLLVRQGIIKRFYHGLT